MVLKTLPRGQWSIPKRRRMSCLCCLILLAWFVKQKGLITGFPYVRLATPGSTDFRDNEELSQLCSGIDLSRQFEVNKLPATLLNTLRLNVTNPRISARELCTATKLGKPIPYLKLPCPKSRIRAKVVFAAAHVSFPEYIELQYLLLKRFLRHDFQFIVFDDTAEKAYDPDNHLTFGQDARQMSEAMKRTCDRLGLTYVRFPQGLHYNRTTLFANTLEPYVTNANTRCADVFQFMLKTLTCDAEYLVMMDADLFLVRPFDVIAFMQRSQTQYAGISVSGPLTYAWNALQFVATNEHLASEYLNYDCGQVCKLTPPSCEPVDVGGQLGYYFSRRVGLTHKSRLSNDFKTNYGPMYRREEDEIRDTGVYWFQVGTLNISKSRDQQLIEFSNGNSRDVYDAQEGIDLNHLIKYPEACWNCVDSNHVSDKPCLSWCVDGYCEKRYSTNATDCRIATNFSALPEIQDATAAWHRNVWEVFEHSFLHTHNGGNWASLNQRHAEIALFVRALKRYFLLK